MKNLFSLSNKKFVALLFIFFFTYLLLRSFFVEPLLDELGSLYQYIQTGNILNEKALLDANNHPLNSFASHVFFRVFGDHFFVYRLFAVLAFPVYFFSALLLVNQLVKSNKTLVFLALISCHWIFEYFAFTRGYGPSLALFLFSLFTIHRWFETTSLKFYVLTIVGLILSCWANLSMFLPVVILLGYLQVLFLINWKSTTNKHKSIFYLLSVIFCASLYPIYKHINALKDAGALWWGSKEGLWEVTGKSISNNVFFTDAIAIKFGLIFLFSVLTIFGFLFWKKNGFKSGITKIQLCISFLFIACLVSYVILANFMNVNYPQDRVGMFLVVLIILIAGIFFSEFERFSWLNLMLFWFPMTFIYHMNLTTSIFSPEDRIHKTFYAELNKIIHDDEVISADYVSHLSYSYLTRNEKRAHLAYENLTSSDARESDYHISWREPINWKGYECVLYDSITKTRLFKNTQKREEKLLFDTIIPSINSKELYINLASFKLDKKLQNKSIRTAIKGALEVNIPTLEINLIQQICQSENKARLVEATRFSWYFGKKKNYEFVFPNAAIEVVPGDEVFNCYLINTEYRTVKLKNIELKIYEVTQ